MVSPAYFAQFFGERIVNITQTAGDNRAFIHTFGAHNLVDGTEVLIKYVVGISNINDLVFPITSVGPSMFTIPLKLNGAYVRDGTYQIASLAYNYLPQLRGH